MTSSVMTLATERQHIPTCREGARDLLQADLLVGDGLDHTDRDSIHKRYGRHHYAKLGK